MMALHDIWARATWVTRAMAAMEAIELRTADSGGGSGRIAAVPRTGWLRTGKSIGSSSQGRTPFLEAGKGTHVGWEQM
jgi:hypothetical protein